MNPERWRRMEELFHRALERDAGERMQWLERETAEDADLREGVERLLEADERGQGAVESVVGRAASEEGREGLPEEGERIGSYEIVREIGRGGTGVVYLAVRADDVFRKQVAIKVVKRGMDTEEILRRFQHERRILASLEHPNIVRTIDGGSTLEGLPYLVMEYVEGVPISEYCEKRALGLRGRVDLFRQVCGAVEYAHQNFIVHRDLKPGNILVDEAGVPRLLDFGIAKLLHPDEGMTELTADGARLLTPQYASPEQVLGEPVTAATDVYALGAILYELLTGRRAHRLTGETPLAMARAIVEEEVHPPSRCGGPMAHLLAGDLDRIVMKAVEKEPRQRYASVEQLGEDLRRYLESEPIRARPLTLRYWSMKFARRNRGKLAAALAVGASLVGGTVVSVQQARRAERRFAQVRKLAHTVVFDVHDAIERLPGSTKARYLVVNTALEYLDSLAKEAEGDGELQWELAENYLRIGRVQGAPRSGPNLGGTENSSESYRKAVALLEELIRKNPEDLRAARALSSSLLQIGDLEQRLGNEKAAVDRYQQSEAIAERLTRNPGGEAADHRLGALALTRLGIVSQESGEPAEAARRYQEAYQHWRKWSEGDPSDRSTNGLAYGLFFLSDGYLKAGDPQRAMELARECISIRERLAAKNPQDMSVISDLGTTYQHAGDVAAHPFLFPKGDGAEGEKYYSKALALAKRQMSADPADMRAKDEVAKLELRIGWIGIPQDARRALRWIEGARASLESLRRQNATDVKVSFHVANADYVFGRALLALRRFGEAQAKAEEAVRVMEGLQGRHDLARRTLPDAAMLAGDVQLAQGRREAAEEWYRKAIEQVEKQASQYPNDVLILRDRANAYEAMGALRRADRDAAGCREWMGQSVAIWENWGQKGVVGEYSRSRLEKANAALTGCGRR